MTAGQHDIVISGVEITNSQPRPLVGNRAGNTNTITFRKCAFRGQKPTVDTGSRWGGGTWVGNCLSNRRDSPDSHREPFSSEVMNLALWLLRSSILQP
jgi:hypothetical protein